MSRSPSIAATAFHDHRLFAAGELPAVALQVKRLLETDPSARVLLFGDHDGRLVDVDLRGSDTDMLSRLPTPPVLSVDEAESAVARGPGRPKLGVVAREVTLLPRHWEWLATQPGGASVALRKLVEEARRASQSTDQRRQAQEAAYRFMSAMAGDEAGFEEAARALFAADQEGFLRAQAGWSADIAAHAQRLAGPFFAP